MRRLVLGLLAACASASVPAATIAATDSRIVEVTVYPDRAEVVREARVELPKGASTIELSEIPFGADPDSIRVSAKGVPATLGAVGASPSSVVGGQSSTGTVTLSAAAPAGGAVVALASASTAFSVPASVTVMPGAAAASFTISTARTGVLASGSLSATYAGVTRTTLVTVTPSPAPRRR